MDDILLDSPRGVLRLVTGGLGQIQGGLIRDHCQAVSPWFAHGVSVDEALNPRVGQAKALSENRGEGASTQDSIRPEQCCISSDVL